MTAEEEVDLQTDSAQELTPAANHVCDLGSELSLVSLMVA